ncbi:MAG: hypothetical protein LBJ02_07275 [Bifidobacteriaceae bacterium]|jgi:hypothetical protein|nr:hypothetical protein [Bifidobacteriaceae bacterium]
MTFLSEGVEGLEAGLEPESATNADAGGPRRRRPRRRKVWLVAGSAVLVVMLGVGGVWFSKWYPHRTLNVFDAVMNVEWEGDEFYRRWDASGDGNMWQPHSEWWFTSDVVEGLQMWIRCPALYDDLGYRNGPTSWWAAQFPDELEVSLVEEPHEQVEVRYRGVYRQETRVLAVWAEVDYKSDQARELFGPGGSEELVLDPDQIEDKLMWVMKELVLPDFLAVNPKVKFTTEDWGNVEVVYRDVPMGCESFKCQ